MKDDLISRQAAIDVADAVWSVTGDTNVAKVWDQIKGLPSAQPEIKPIEYRDCANAMLKMWMDNVVTDGEYNRIMDKLNAHWRMKNG
jgi:hypothetical protein